jgi:hypothetical protein
MNTLLILLSLGYPKLIPDDALFESLIRSQYFQLQNVRFSIPPKFLGLEKSVYSQNILHTLTANFEYFYDSTGTLDLFPRFFYKYNNTGVVIEPLFRLGKVRGWPYAKWQDIVCGAYSRAYWYYELPNLIFLLGRNKLQVNLEGILSEEDPPIDGFLSIFRGKHVNFSFFLGQLDSRIPRDSSHFYETGKLYNRYLSIHSLEYKIKRLTFSFTEAVLYFSNTNMPDWYFLNPFMIYHPRVLDSPEGGEHNTFWILSGNYWGAKFSSHFEFLIDDFHLPDPDQWAPHKLAWIFKSYVIDFPFKASVSGLSYTGATRWTYTHGLSLLYYNNRGEVMGNLNENDFDKLEIFTRKHFSNKLDLKTSFWFKRKGEANTEEKDFYWERGIDYPREYFLTGIVEKRLGTGIELDFHTTRIVIRSNFEYDWIWNYRHLQSNKGSELRLKLYGSAGIF